MAVVCNVIPERLTRVSNIPPATGDFSCVFWLRITVAPSGGGYVSLWETFDLSGNWTGIYTDSAAADGIYFEANSPGGGYQRTVGDFNFPLGSQYIPYGYVRQGDDHRFYALGSLIGQFTLDMAGVTWVGTLMASTENVGTDRTVQAFNYREWDAALTLPQLIAEWKATAAVLTADLNADCPLATDLFDDSGNGNHWTAPVAVTFAGQPPTQIQPVTAIELGSLPYAGSHAANSSTDDETFNLCFTFVAPAGIDAAGAWAFGGTPNVGFSPEIYKVDFDNVDTPSAQSIGDNMPMLLTVTPGERYYLRTVKNGNQATATVTLSVVGHTEELQQQGDILITSDATDLPSVVLPPDTDYAVRRITTLLPSSDNADIAPATGNILTEDQNTLNLLIYNQDFELVADLGVSDAAHYNIRASRLNNTFYAAAKRSTPVTLRIYDDVGGSLGTKTISGYAGFIRGIAPNNAQTLVYFGTSIQTDSIYVFDLATETVTGTFAPGIAFHTLNEIMVLEDDTVVASFYRLSVQSFIIRTYDSAGNQLTTATYSADGSFAPRIGYALDSPISYWVFVQDVPIDDDRAHFLNVRTSDAVTLTTRKQRIFESAGYIGAETATPDARFGPPSSCAMLVLALASEPPVGVGTVTVRKVLLGGGPQPFDFTASADPFTFTLVDGGEQVFADLPAGVYSFEEDVPDGYVLVSTEVSNGDAASAVTVADGDEIVVTFTNAVGSGEPDPAPSTLNATLLRMRRLRRTAYLSDDDFRIFYHRLQVDAQVGMGLGGAEQQGSNPQMMVKWSDDGGNTWSNEHWTSLGRVGAFTWRAMWNRLGMGRSRIFEIVVSDPVAWRLLASYLQLAKGNN